MGAFLATGLVELTSGQNIFLPTYFPLLANEDFTFISIQASLTQRSNLSHICFSPMQAPIQDFKASKQARYLAGTDPSSEGRAVLLPIFSCPTLENKAQANLRTSAKPVCRSGA